MPSDDPNQISSRGPLLPRVDIPLDTLFAAMSDIVFVIDRDGRYLWGAPTIAAQSDESQRRGRWILGKTIHEAVEEQHEADRMLAAVRAALDTGVTQNIEYQITLWGLANWFSASVSRLSEDRVVWVARQITELVAARTELEQRVEERTRELTTLLDISRTLTTARDLRSLVETILTQMKNVIDYSGASVLAMGEGEIDVVESLGPGGREDLLSGRRIPIDGASPLWRRLLNRETIILVDARSDEELSIAFRGLVASLGVPTVSYVRSWMAVPLTLEERVVGVLTMSRDTPGYFTERHVELATAVARQAAVVAENAQLFEETQRRTLEQASLLEVSHAITSTLELPKLLEILLDQLSIFVDYAGAAFTLLDDGMFQIVALRRPRGPAPFPGEMDARFPADTYESLGFTLEQDAFAIIDDVHDDSAGARLYRSQYNGDLKGTPVEYVRSLMALTLSARGNVVGVLTLAHDEPGYFRQDHAGVLRPFAQQAAIAIDNARLFEDAEARTRELAAIVEVSRAISSTLELEPLLNALLDQLKLAVPYDGAGISLHEGDQVRQVAVRRPAGYTPAGPAHVTARSAYQVMEEPLLANQIINIPDVLDDSDASRAFRDSWGGDLKGTTAEWVRSMIVVPLLMRDQIIGTIALGNKQPGFYTDKHIAIVQSAVRQVAAAIENARLFEQTEARSRELASILEVSRAVASTLDFSSVLRIVLAEIERLIGTTGASVLTIEGDHLVFRDVVNVPGRRDQVGLGIPLASAGLMWQTLSNREPVVIADVRDATPMAADYRRTIDELGMADRPPFQYVRSWMGVPLFVQDRIIGMLTMSRTVPDYFTADHARLAGIFADQVAVAIENARLFEAAQGVAALEERQRLARELHDSVSQALYGIALGARTAMTQLQRDASKASEPVEYILSLAEAGLAEMRALIFELRPESMETEGLVAAIEKQAAAGRARYGIAIDAELGQEPEAPLETKEALYRIAQEALHNIVKHARATNVTISLEAQGSALLLRIADDGAGFDPTADYAGHLGLRSMRERASLIGGSLEITSESGAGTTIVATVPVSR